MSTRFIPKEKLSKKSPARIERRAANALGRLPDSQKG